MISIVVANALGPNTVAQELSLDPAFGEQGIARVDLGGDAEGGAGILITSTGRIIQVGSTNRPFILGTGGTDLALIGYTPGGTLDATFGAGGVVMVDVDGEQAFNEDGVGIAETVDGSVLVSGRAVVRNQPNQDALALVARFTPNGQLDPSFGTGGVVLFDAGPGADHAPAVFTSTGSRVVVGVAGGYFDTTGDFAAAQLLSNGSLDSDYGTGGIARIDIGPYDEPRAFAMDASGRLLAAGYTGPNDAYGEARVVVARWLATGAPDHAFGDEGHVVIDVPGGWEVANGIVLDEAGITIIGWHLIPAPTGGSPVYKALVARLTPAGVLDPSFGIDGVVLHELDPVPAYSFLYAAEPAGDGTLLAGGWTFRQAGPGDPGGYHGVIARVLPDGSLDASFSSPFDYITDVVLHLEGSLLANVNGSFPAVGDFVVARFLALPPVTTAPPVPPERGLRVSAVSPNPVDGIGVLHIATDTEGQVRVVLLDVLGRTLRVLHDEVHAARSARAVPIHLGGSAPGVYVVRVEGPGNVVSRRFTHIR